MSKGIKMAEEFLSYCKVNPSMRFWQALRSWSGHNFIFASHQKDKPKLHDTFYWDGKGNST